MTAQKAVADGRMTDSQLVTFTRRTDEIKRRLNEGTLLFTSVKIALQQIIEGRYNPIPVWKTVAMPIKLDREGYDRLSVEADSGTRYLVGRYLTGSTHDPEEYDLVKVRVCELCEIGFPGSIVSNETIVGCVAQDLGLSPLSMEDLLTLRLAYYDQPTGEELWTIVQFSTDPRSYCSFMLDTIGGLHITCGRGLSGFDRTSEVQIVFKRKKQG